MTHTTHGWDVMVANRILEMTSLVSTRVRNDAVKQRILTERSGQHAKVAAEKLRTAVKLLVDAGFVSTQTLPSGVRVVDVIDRDGMKSWLASGAPKIERNPTSEAVGRSCRQKVRHPSAESAQEHSKRIGGEVYSCPHCGGWHTASPLRAK